MELIRNNKVFVAIIVGLFFPTGIMMGALSILTGLINWVVGLGLVTFFVGRKVYELLTREEEDNYGWE